MSTPTVHLVPGTTTAGTRYWQASVNVGRTTYSVSHTFPAGALRSLVAALAQDLEKTGMAYRLQQESSDASQT